MNKDKNRYINDRWEIENRIRKYREQRGYARFDLAEALNLKDERSIYYYEMGEKLPSLDKFLIICEFLDISLDDLLANG